MDLENLPISIESAAGVIICYFMKYVIISRYPFNPNFSVEGRGYRGKTEAERYIRYFKEKINALNEIQKKYFNEEIVGHDKIYAVGTVNIPQSFFKD